MATKTLATDMCEECDRESCVCQRCVLCDGPCGDSYYCGPCLQPAYPACFRCGSESSQWFDGTGAQELGIARAICRNCEYQDWRAAIRALAAPQG